MQIDTKVPDLLNNNNCEWHGLVTKVSTSVVRQKNPYQMHSYTPILQQSLRDSDRIICEELERIRAAVDDIQDVQLQEEKKRLDYSFYDNSPFSLQATDDNDMNQKLFEEYFGCLFTDVEGTTRKRGEKRPI